MSWLSKARRKLTRSAFKVAGSKLGSVLTGRAIIQGRISKQDLQASGGKLIDLFGSPATAGTRFQTAARAAAVIYGAAVGASALAASSGAGTTAAGTTVATSGGGTAGSVGLASGGGYASTVAATSGGVAGSGSFFSGFSAAAGKALTAGLLARSLSLLNPKMPGETLPQENVYGDGGLGGAIYPMGAPFSPGASEFGGTPISYTPEGTPIPESGFSIFSPFMLAGIGAVVIALFFVFRR